MRFTSLIWKNLRRRPFRTGLTLFALSSAIAAVVALLGIARGFQDSFADVYRSHAVDIVVSRQGAADRLSSSVDETLARRVSGIPNVEKTAAVLLETLSLEDEGVYGVPAMGIDTDSWMLDSYQMERQSPNEAAGDPNEAEGDPNVVFLGVHLAQRLEKRPGDVVHLFDEPFTIDGVFTSRSTWENGSMIVPLSGLQALTGREGQVTYVNVVIDPDVAPDEASRIVSDIEAIDAKLLALTTEEFVATDTRMQIASAMAWMTSMIAVLIGAIGTLNTMMTSVIERTGEIGILRAIGWPRRRVVGMILGESCLLSVIAGGSGVLLAIGLTWMLSRSPAVAGILQASISPAVIAQGLAIGLAIGMIGAIIPAVRAARMLPTDAFRDLA